jgi:hypothetical protein
MTQPSLAAIRTALATTLDAIPGLRAYANRSSQVDPPAVLVLPIQGTFIQYGATFDGAANFSLRAVLLTAKGDSTDGQAAMDPFLDVSGASSIYACLQANSTLGGVVQFAALMEATGYGPLSVGAMDYLGCHLIISIGI